MAPGSLAEYWYAKKYSDIIEKGDFKALYRFAKEYDFVTVKIVPVVEGLIFMLAVPALPLASQRPVNWGLWRNRQARACSRPPEPTMSTFTGRPSA